MDIKTVIIQTVTKHPGCYASRISRIHPQFSVEQVRQEVESLISTFQLRRTPNKKLYIIKNPARAEFNAKRRDSFHSDEHNKIMRQTRTKMIRLINRGNPKRNNRFAKILGCSVADFCKYLESQFEPGMTWENHGIGKGKWNIDHIKPCAEFDLTDPEQFAACWHHTNMRPLWAEVNLAIGGGKRRKLKALD